MREGGDMLASPIPLKRGVSNEPTFAKNEWFPKINNAFYKNAPDMSAKSAILVNFNSGDVIYAKDPNARLAGASTVKIMTAMIALERAKLSDVYTVSKKAAEIGEDSMGLTEGEKLKVGELLYGLMLPSGNDAAVTLAEGVSGSENAFVSLMNARAREIGLVDTKFINASGLDIDGDDQYLSSFDLATLAHYAWVNYGEFSRVTSTYHTIIDQTSTHKAFDLTNETNLLTTYPGVRGIKPGFTWNAGLCLVTYAENNGVRLIGVIMGSENRRAEMKELLDYGFLKYGIKVEHPALDL